MKTIHKSGLISLVLLVLAAGAFYLPRNIMVYSGYCLSEGRYLSPKEKIDRAVFEDIVLSNPSRVYINDDHLNKDSQNMESNRFIASHPYADLEEFYALNPDCCFFFNDYTYGGLGTRSMPLRRRLQGVYNPPYLYITYIAAFDWQNNNAPIYRVRYFAFTNCGRPIRNPDIDDFFQDWPTD